MIPAVQSTEPGLQFQTMKELQTLIETGIKEGNVTDAVPALELKHLFIPGAYARSVWRPAGTLIVGKTHRFACFTFLMTGRMRIWTEDGVQDRIAGEFWTSPAGAKRVTFAYEDSLLVTVHPTNETDPDLLEIELTIPEIEALENKL